MHDDTRTTGSSEDTAASVRPAGGLHRLWVLPVVAVVLAATAAVVAVRPGAPPHTGPAALVPPNVATVQNQYATDLVARINAERAARSQAALPVPPLQEDPALVSAAQAWSAHLAAVGSVADPPPALHRPRWVGPGSGRGLRLRRQRGRHRQRLLAR